MQVDASLEGPLEKLAASAKRLEALGYDGATCSELGHDGFVTLAVAAQHTQRIQLVSNLVVALARNPMSVAYAANDVRVLSQGRFILGLGSQVRPHIERRFGMPWSKPAARMKEFVAALRHIWQCWDTGSPLSFRGDFYQHTLMTPFFTPSHHTYGPPPVFMAAVGEKMAEVVGEVADGLLVHPFCTEQYLRERLIPAVNRGRSRAGRLSEPFGVAVTPFVVSGQTEEEVRRVTEGVRSQLSFYGSTPAYRPVLELHGWGSLHEELLRLSRKGQWADMAGLIEAPVVDAFAVRGEPDEIGPRLKARYGGIATRLSFYRGLEPDPRTVAYLRSSSPEDAAGAHS